MALADLDADPDPLDANELEGLRSQFNMRHLLAKQDHQLGGEAVPRER
jgi:hypothetical protein